MVEEFLHTVSQWIAANPGWINIIVFLTALSESLAVVGLIMPGAMMMFGFGAIITLSNLNFWTIFGWAVAGAVAGDGLSFWAGRAFHQRLRGFWPFARHPEILARGEVFFRRHGGKSVLLGRFFGPVRPVIPLVAGMLDMPPRRFLLVNVFSALLWAPAYLIPGMVFAASLELASQVAWRLVVLIVLVVCLLVVTVRLVRGLFRLLHPRIHGWLLAFSEWSQNRRFIGPVSNSLLDPAQGELRGLTTLAVLLLGGVVLLGLMLNAVDEHLPTALDQSLYRFLQDLRTPWADELMVYVTELGDYPVKVSLAVAVFAWLYWTQARTAALHWLAALGFGLVTNALCKWLFHVPRPLDAYSGLMRYAFPSNHATMATILFGFLAVLIARETAPERRWIPYLTAALIVIPIAFSRLYLGLHWATDTLAGLSLGLIWVALLGLAYHRHAERPVPRRGLLIVALAALVVADTFHTGLHHRSDLQLYRTPPVQHTLTRDGWWTRDWQQLPAYRMDFAGHRRQALEFQWATSRTALERHLLAAGWQTAPTLTPSRSLMWLNPQVQIADLPVLPQIHDGRNDSVVLVRPGAAPNTRWVLRFWDAGVRLREDATPVWLGSLSLQEPAWRMDFFTFAEEIAYTQSPRALLLPAWQGLRQRTVVVPGDSAEINLIADCTENTRC